MMLYARSVYPIAAATVSMMMLRPGTKDGGRASGVRDTCSTDGFPSRTPLVSDEPPMLKNAWDKLIVRGSLLNRCSETFSDATSSLAWRCPYAKFIGMQFSGVKTSRAYAADTQLSRSEEHTSELQSHSKL